jgi:5'-3' exonuclease
MGLLAVPKFIKEKYGHLYHTEHISLFAHTRVFVDIASYLYKYVCTFGCTSSRWLNSFANLMLTFVKNGVIVVVIFDGQAPDAKADEQRERRELRSKTKERADVMQEALEAFELGTITTEQRQLLVKELQDRRAYNQQRQGSLLHPSSSSEGGETTTPTLTPGELQELRDIVRSLQKQCTSLSKQDMLDLKQLLTACGVTWMQAPEEAEAYACWLVRQGYGSAVVSCDTDCIAHRADIVVFEVDSRTGMIRYVNTQELLDAWELDDEEQLIDFGILVGCDYNPGSRVNKIGPVSAVKLLKQYKSIDNIPNLKDVSVLQHEKIRLLFNPQYEEPHIEALVPNQELLQELKQRREDLDERLAGQLIYHRNTKRLISVVSTAATSTSDDDEQKF